MEVPNSPETKSIFDPRCEPDQELLDDCVHCGFCLPSCPTYVLWGREADSPRGRIYLMQLGKDGRAELSTDFVTHFDQCLGCMACVTACPSGVQYEKLIETTRAQIERKFPRSSSDRQFRRFLFALFPYPDRLRALLPMLRLYQRSGLGGLLRRSGIMKRLPPRWQALEALMPSLHGAPVGIPELTPAQATKRKRVGLLLGCIQQVFFSEVNAATARVLAAEGCEVAAPGAQSCCGALMLHAGMEAEAQKMARRLIDSFERAGVDSVVVNAAGCGSVVKEYGHLLRNDPQYAERAKAFAARCKDVTELLAELTPRAPRHPIRLKVAYHDACHLQHAQRVREQPRRLLRAIPQLELLEVPDSTMCCGSAGIYNLLEPKTAEELGDRKAGQVLATGAVMLATGNPGCSLQLRNSIHRLGKDLPIVHPIQLIDASIRNLGSEDLNKKGR